MSVHRQTSPTSRRTDVLVTGRPVAPLINRRKLLSISADEKCALWGYDTSPQSDMFSGLVSPSLMPPYHWKSSSIDYLLSVLKSSFCKSQCVYFRHIHNIFVDRLEDLRSWMLENPSAMCFKRQTLKLNSKIQCHRTHWPQGRDRQWAIRQWDGLRKALKISIWKQEPSLPAVILMYDIPEVYFQYKAGKGL